MHLAMVVYVWTQQLDSEPMVLTLYFTTSLMTQHFENMYSNDIFYINTYLNSFMKYYKEK